MTIVALGYALACLVMAVAGFHDTGYAGDAWWADLIAVIATGTFLAFMYGLNWERPWVVRTAYLITAGLYVARGMFIVIMGDTWAPAGWLSLASGVVAFGLFWHVRSEHGRARRVQ